MRSNLSNFFIGNCEVIDHDLERLGHSDAAITLNAYSHTILGMLRDAARKMDEIAALIDIIELLDSPEN